MSSCSCKVTVRHQRIRYVVSQYLLTIRSYVCSEPVCLGELGSCGIPFTRPDLERLAVYRMGERPQLRQRRSLPSIELCVMLMHSVKRPVPDEMVFSIVILVPGRLTPPPDRLECFG